MGGSELGTRTGWDGATGGRPPGAGGDHSVSG